MGVRKALAEGLINLAESFEYPRYRTEVTLGCEDCPNRRTTSFLGTACIKLTAPYQVEVSMVTDISRRHSEETSKVIFGEKCDDSGLPYCEYSESIENFSNEIASDPYVLNRNFEE